MQRHLKLVKESVLTDDEELRKATMKQNENIAQHDTDIAVLQHRMDDHKDILTTVQRDVKTTAVGIQEVIRKLEHRIGFKSGSLWVAGFILMILGE